MEEPTQHKKQKIIPVSIYIQGGIFLVLSTLAGLYIFDLFFNTYDNNQQHHQLQHKQSASVPSGSESKDWANLFTDLNLKLETSYYNTSRSNDLTNLTNQIKNINTSLLTVKDSTTNASTKSDLDSLFDQIDGSINTTRGILATDISNIDLTSINTNTNNKTTILENRLIDIQGNVTDIDDIVNTIETSVGTIQSDVTTINTNMASTTDVGDIKTAISGVQTTATDTKTNTATIISSINSTDNDVQGVATQVTNLQTSVSDMSTVVNTIDTDVNTTLTAIGSISSTLAAADAVQSNIYLDTGDIKTQNGNIISSLSAADTVQSNISGKVDNLVTAVGGVTNKTNIIDGKVDGLVTDLTTVVNGFLSQATYDTDVSAQNLVILGYINQVLGNMTSINSTEMTLLAQIKTVVDAINTDTDYGSRFDSVDSEILAASGQITNADQDIIFDIQNNIYSLSGIALSKLNYSFYSTPGNSMVTFQDSNMIFEYDDSNEVVALKIWSSGDNITKLNLCKSGTCQNMKYLEVNQQTDLSGLCSGPKACNSLEFVKFNYDIIPSDFCNGSNVKVHFIDDDACQSLQIVDQGSAATINAGFCSNGCNSMQKLVANNVVTIQDMCADDGCNNLMYIELLNIAGITSLGEMPNLQSIRVNTVDTTNQQINGGTDNGAYAYLISWAVLYNKSIDVIANDGVYTLTSTGFTAPAGM